jgi:hypothetical protein
MATTPALFWYPDAYGTLETTDLDESLSALDLEPVREVVDARALSGRYGAAIAGAGRLAVRVVLERFTSETLAMALASFSAHAEGGQPFGFAVDQSKAWAGFSTSVGLSRGGLSVPTGGDVFYGGGTLAAGDWVCIEGCGTEAHREYKRVDSVSASVFGTIITLTGALDYSYNDACVMVRHRDFYPILHWPTWRRRAPILTTTRRINWTLDATFETDPGACEAVYNATGNYPGIFRGSIFSPSKYAIQDILQTVAALSPRVYEDSPARNRDDWG